MITIYRIEHSRASRENGMGYGPYIIEDKVRLTGHWYERMCNNHMHLTHPGMRDDMPNYYEISDKSNFYCGFQSIEDMKKWFKGYVTGMKKDGFVIKKYLVSKITESHSGLQTFFNINNVIASEIYK